MNRLRTFEQSVAILRDDDEYEIDVEYTATPYVPASMPSFNDPGCPAEGGEIEIVRVTLNGAPFDLTEEEEQVVYDRLHEMGDDAYEDEPDWDWQRDRDIDDKLTGFEP